MGYGRQQFNSSYLCKNQENKIFYCIYLNVNYVGGAMGYGRQQFNASYLSENTKFLRILGPLCLASLGLEGLDQARLHLTLSRHIIFGFAPRILGPLCLASLGLEGLDQARLHLTLSRHIMFG